MAPANDSTGQRADLSNFVGSVNTGGQTGDSLAILSLDCVVDTHGNAVGASEPREHVQFDTAVGAAATDRICPDRSFG